MENKPLPRWHIAVLLGLECFVIFIFTYFNSHFSIRLDEAQSIWQTSKSIPKIIEGLSRNVHVPVYHILIHLWQTLFGNTVEINRLFSLVFYAVSIPVFYAFGSQLYNRSIALYATVLFSLSPFLIWFSSETRMYTLVTLLSICAHYLYIVLMREPKKITWIAYGLCSLVGIYTHYFFFLILISHAFFYFYARREFKQKQLFPFLVVAGSLFILFVPWLVLFFKGQQIDSAQPILTAPNTVDIFNIFSHFLFGFQTDQINSLILSLWPLIPILLFLGLQKTAKFRIENTFIIITCLIPMIIAYVVSVAYQPLFLSRYLIVVLPSLFLLISEMVLSYPRYIRNTVLGLLTLIMLASLWTQTTSRDTPAQENYRDASSYLSERARPQDIIVVTAPFTIYPVLYYYTGEAHIETLPRWNRFTGEIMPGLDASTLPNEVEKIKGSHEFLYLLMSYDQGYHDIIKEYFDKNFDRVDKITFSQGLDLYVYQMRYDIKN